MTSAHASTATPRETFSITYTIEIDVADPTRAHVRWSLAGIDELERIRLRFDPPRFDGFAGNGTIERRRGELLWFPQGPYAELRYVAHVDHRRAPDKGYDSYAGDGWILARTTACFPRSAALFRREVEPAPESRARLVLRLPHGWDSATVFPTEDGPNRYVIESPQRFDHPRGWMLLGRLKRTDVTSVGTTLTIARAPGIDIHVDHTVDLLTRALPLLGTLFERPLSRLLVVIGPDPMWRGGLSGEQSFYMHADRPLRTRDHTSPYLHELFHVAAPFRPAEDAHWVTEGLAEYYSIEIPRRLGSFSEATYHRALELFAIHGVWGQDFTRTAAAALRNNSAPLVMWDLDRRIRAATNGARGLDAVVTSLAHDGGAVSTGRFLGTVQRVAGKSFAGFFRRHVYRGEQPALGPAPQ
jgi:predicted metalloprotease with PDZ domain